MSSFSSFKFINRLLFLIILDLLLLFGLTNCGMQGPLYLPEKNSQIKSIPSPK